MDEQELERELAHERERELARISERITVVANWLIQDRCGDDAECVAARLLEMETLKRRRTELEADLPA
jgi:hypothetical protein